MTGAESGHVPWGRRTLWQLFGDSDRVRSFIWGTEAGNDGGIDCGFGAARSLFVAKDWSPRVRLKMSK